MSRWIDLAVLGDKALDARLDALDKGTAMKAVRPGLRAGAKALLPLILTRVPILTGKLRNTPWKIRAAKRKRGRVGVAVLTPTREALGIPQDEPYYYPAALELGREGQPAQSYMRAGLKAGESAALEALKATLWARLEKLAAGRDPGEDVEA